MVNGALAIAGKLLDTAAGRSPDEIIPFLWLLRAQALAMLDQHQAAVALLQQAIASDNQTDDSLLAWRLHLNNAHFLRASGREAEAQQQAAMTDGLIHKLAETIDDEPLRRCYLERASAML